MMKVNNSGTVMQPSGEEMKKVQHAVYLGGLLNKRAEAKPEITKQMGQATGVFDSLKRCWGHANITLRRKLELYIAIIVRALLYIIGSLWLLGADRQRL